MRSEAVSRESARAIDDLGHAVLASARISAAVGMRGYAALRLRVDDETESVWAFDREGALCALVVFGA